jgi:hypothetical protein
MILYQLQCDGDHAFEAWFRDSAAYDIQSGRGLLACPICDSEKVSKALMAPSIGRSTGERDEHPVPARADITDGQVMSGAVELRAQLADLRQKIEASCDYVGPGFAEEARKIHYGETDPHGIYGETSQEEAKALKDEGIEFGAVPWLPKENA